MEEKRNERVTIRLPEETLFRMENFLNAHQFKNRSEFVRAAVEEYMERRRFQEIIYPTGEEKIAVELPNKALTVLKFLIQGGYMTGEAAYGQFSMLSADWIFEEAKKYTGKTPEEIGKTMLELERKMKDGKQKVAEFVRK